MNLVKLRQIVRLDQNCKLPTHAHYKSKKRSLNRSWSNRFSSARGQAMMCMTYRDQRITIFRPQNRILLFFFGCFSSCQKWMVPRKWHCFLNEPSDSVESKKHFINLVIVETNELDRICSNNDWNMILTWQTCGQHSSSAYAFETNLSQRSFAGVPSGRAFPGFPITAHHLPVCAFLLYLEGSLCGGITKKKGGVAGSKRRALAFYLSVRIWYVNLNIKCRRESDLGLCMSSVVAKRMRLRSDWCCF